MNAVRNVVPQPMNPPHLDEQSKDLLTFPLPHLSTKWPEQLANETRSRRLPQEFDGDR